MTTPNLPPDLDATALLDVRSVAKMLGCSTRNVFRLSANGKMPSPLKIGVLVRWRQADLDAWLAAGCPPIRQPENA